MQICCINIVGIGYISANNILKRVTKVTSFSFIYSRINSLYHSKNITDKRTQKSIQRRVENSISKFVKVSKCLDLFLRRNLARVMLYIIYIQLYRRSSTSQPNSDDGVLIRQRLYRVGHHFLCATFCFARYFPKLALEILKLDFLKFI